MSAPIAGATLLADEQGSYPALTGMVPAETGRRIAARIIEAVIMTVVTVVAYSAVIGGFLSSMSAYSSNYDEPSLGGLYFGSFIGIALPIVLLFVEVYCYVKKGNHMGGAILGLVNVDVTTGQKATGKAVGKAFVSGLVSAFTFSIVTFILCLATVNGTTRRNAFDRMMGVMVVDTKQGTGPRVAGPGPVAVAKPTQYQRHAIEAVSLSSGAGAVGQPPAVGPAQAAIRPISYQQPGSTPPAMGVPFGLPPETPRTPAQVAASPTAAAPIPPKLPTYSDPFAEPGAAPAPDSIRSVAQPGAHAFIEATPFSAARPPVAEPAVPTPFNQPPIVVREMTSVAAGAVIGQNADQTVVDGEAFTPTPGSPVAKVTGLLLDDQTELSTTEVTLLGRNPIGDAISDLGPTVALPVADPDMAISKTHVAVGVADGQWWVMDLRSTNGTQLVAADGTVTKIDPGAKTVVPAGASVRFGSHLIKAKP